MFSAVLIPNSNTPSWVKNMQEKVVVYLPYNNYILYIFTHDDIPESFLDQIEPVVYDTKISIPIRYYMKIHTTTNDIVRPEHNRQLISTRSNLVFNISELLAPDSFYFSLEQKYNNVKTKRTYVYVLQYNGYPCYMLKNDDLMETLAISVNMRNGPLIMSTYSLENILGPNDKPVPKWYIREIFRDVIELNEVDVSNMLLRTGHNSGELYLFYQDEVNLSDDTLRDLITRVRGSIVTSIRLKIFPRQTSQIFVNSRQLVLTPKKQWTIPYDIPEKTPFLSWKMHQCIVFKSLGQLFLFMIWLMLCPTFKFIEKEMKIYIQNNGIKVIHETNYLKDYIRIRSASRVSSNNELNKSMKIYYPEQEQSDSILPKDGTYIRVYDSENNQDVIIATKYIGTSDKSYVPKIPTIETDDPTDYNLQTRISMDFNII